MFEILCCWWHWEQLCYYYSSIPISDILLYDRINRGKSVNRPYWMRAQTILWQPVEQQQQVNNSWIEIVVGHDSSLFSGQYSFPIYQSSSSLSSFPTPSLTSSRFEPPLRRVNKTYAVINTTTENSRQLRPSSMRSVSYS